jgi:rhodanese-related sulfurtransferase
VSARSALCLPISVETLLDARSRDGAIKFFVVDCRTQAEYDSGHLPHAWHLDVQLVRPSLRCLCFLKTVNRL